MTKRFTWCESPSRTVCRCERVFTVMFYGGGCVFCFCFLFLFVCFVLFVLFVLFGLGGFFLFFCLFFCLFFLYVFAFFNRKKDSSIMFISFRFFQFALVCTVSSWLPRNSITLSTAKQLYFALLSFIAGEIQKDAVQFLVFFSSSL